MVSIEKIKRKAVVYYYITKNFRIGKNMWKKIRRYVGKNEPTKNDIYKIAKEIEEEAIKKGLAKKQMKYEYFTDEEAEVMEDIRHQYNRFLSKLPQESLNKYIDDFLIRFTYNSNAIEGNRLSLRDTYLIMQQNIMPQNATTHEYNEVINGKKCMKFIRDYKGEFNQTFLLKVHRILTENTAVKMSGVYRDHNVIITGSSHKPPNFKEINELMKRFLIWYNNSKRKYHPLELACLVHTRLTRIHPFSDGNGRTARIVSNFILHKNRYPLFFVDVKDRIEYYHALDDSDAGNERTFIRFIFNNIIQQLKSNIS